MKTWWTLGILLALSIGQTKAGWGFVNPQSSCRIRCENGGVCTFLHEDPRQHSCVCLIGMFTGDRCQYPVNPNEESTQEPTAHHPPQAVDPRYIERQRQDEQRRAEHQRRLEEHEQQQRRRQEEERRIQEARTEARRRMEANRASTERTRTSPTTSTGRSPEEPTPYGNRDWEDYHEDSMKQSSAEMTPPSTNRGGWDQQSISEDPTAPEEVKNEDSDEDSVELGAAERDDEEEEEDYLGANELEKTHEIEEQKEPESTTPLSSTTRHPTKGDRHSQEKAMKEDGAEEEGDVEIEGEEEAEEEGDEESHHDYLADQESDPDGWMMMKRRQTANSSASFISSLLSLSILFVLLPYPVL